MDAQRMRVRYAVGSMMALTFWEPCNDRLFSEVFSIRIATLALAFGLLLAPLARADDVPGIGRWDHDFFSLDPSPVRAEFKSGPFNMPRKYIVGVLNYKNGGDVYVGGPSDSFEEIRCSYTSHALFVLRLFGSKSLIVFGQGLISSTSACMEREGKLAGLDLGQVEHGIDQAEQMLAVALDPF
jgi:hypothetical protein